MADLVPACCSSGELSVWADESVSGRTERLPTHRSAQVVLQSSRESASTSDVVPGKDQKWGSG